MKENQTPRTLAIVAAIGRRDLSSAFNYLFTAFISEFARMIAMKRTNKKDFAKKLVRELRRGGFTSDIHYDSMAFRLTFPDDEAPVRTVELAHLYDEYCRIPAAARRRHLQRMARVALSPHTMADDFPSARVHLLPKVRCRTYAEVLRLAGEAGVAGRNEPFQKVGEYHVASLVYDFPDSMRTISQSDLDGWGVSFDEAMAAALENLRQLPFATEMPAPCVYSLEARDNYVASRLLLTEFIHGLKVQGDPVVLAPNRDSLFIAGSHDERGLRAITKVARDATDRGWPINAMPLRLSNMEYNPWTPGPEHPAFEYFRRIETDFLFKAYALQKQMLDELYEKRDEGAFIASYNVVMSDAGSQLSSCVWTRGIEILLPRTDQVAFVDKDEDGEFAPVGFASWEMVQRVVGDRLVPVNGLFPTRFRVAVFPAPEELQAMGSEPLGSW